MINHVQVHMREERQAYQSVSQELADAIEQNFRAVLPHSKTSLFAATQSLVAAKPAERVASSFPFTPARGVTQLSARHLIESLPVRAPAAFSQPPATPDRSVSAAGTPAAVDESLIGPIAFQVRHCAYAAL